MKELERQQSQLVGTVGALQSSIAAGKGKISELELMILQVDQNLRSQITDQISNAQQAIASLTEREIEAKTLLLQSTIYAPQSGTVYQLAVHTRGQVIKGGETLMTIVPERDTLVGLVKVSPADIDQLYTGQQTLVTFSAFDRGTTPTINATLSSISPDLKQDPQMGTLYYQARIAVSPAEMERLGAVKVVPGMPIEVFINTGDRTLVSYFLKPLTDQMNRAFR
jgi:HlyD family secretion protein